MTSLFISYSRKDIEIARKLTAGLKAQDLDFWIDWEGIPPTVDWWNEIQKGIEEADVFIFLISPDSSVSKVCKQEIEHAVKNGKRLIPLVVRDIKGEETPAELSSLNWIFLRASDDFEPAFAKLMTAIKTDYDWVQVHRQLQVKALEWDRGSKENSFLLRGRELQDAELQLAANGAKEPHPTDLQREYVLKSRLAASRQRRTTTAVVTAVVIALIVLSVVAFIQAGLATANERTAQAASTLAFDNAVTAQANAQEAQKQAEIARARELSAQAELNLVSSPSRALLLAIEAIRFNTSANVPLTASVRQAMYDAFKNVEADALPGSQDPVNSLQLTANGTWLLTYSDDNVQAWRMSQPWGSPIRVKNASVRKATPGGRALLGKDANLEIWDFSLDPPKQIMQFTFDQEFGFTESGFDYYIDANGFIDQYTLSDDGRWFAILNKNKSVSIFDLDSPQKEPTVTPVPYGLEQEPRLELSAKGDWFVIHHSAAREAAVYRLEFNNAGSLVNVRQERVLKLDNLQFSKDGRWMLLQASQVELWNNGPAGPTNPILLPENLSYVIFSNDSKWLVGSDEQQTYLWGLPDELPVTVDLQPVSGLPISTNVHSSPDDRFIFLFRNNALSLWDSVKRSVTSTPLNEDYLPDVEFLSDSSGFLVLGASGQLILYSTDLSGQRILGSFPNTYRVSIPANSHLAVLRDGVGKIHVLDLDADSRMTVERFATTRSYSEFAVSSDGRWLIAGSDSDPVPRVWDLQNLRSELDENTVRLFPGGQDPEITGQSYGQNPSPSFAFSSDGRWLANLAGSTGQLFDLSGAIATPIFLGPKVTSLSFSPDNHYLSVSTGSTFTVDIWNLSGERPVRESTYTIATSNWVLDQVEFSPDGKWLGASTPWQIFLLEWDKRLFQDWQVLGKPPTSYGGGGGGQADFRPGDNLVFSRDGHWLAIGKNLLGVEGQDVARVGKSLWNLHALSDAPVELQDPYPFFDTNNMVYSPNGRWLVTVPATSGIASLWDLEAADSRPSYQQLVGNRRLVSAVAFSADSRWLATGHGNDIYLWDLTSEDPRSAPRIVQGHTDTIWSLAFSPDGQTLASGSRDNTIRIWDMNAANITTSAVILYGHTAEVYDLAFVDANTVISNSLDGTTRLWHLNFNKMMLLACKRAGRNLTEQEWALYLGGETFRDVCSEWSASKAMSPGSESPQALPAVTASVQPVDTSGAVETLTLTPTTPTAAATGEGMTRYTVQAGDSLSSIAQKFNVPLEIIIRDNNLSDPNSILVGQILLIRSTATPTPNP